MCVSVWLLGRVVVIVGDVKTVDRRHSVASVSKQLPARLLDLWMCAFVESANASQCWKSACQELNTSVKRLRCCENEKRTENCYVLISVFVFLLSSSSFAKLIRWQYKDANLENT